MATSLAAAKEISVDVAVAALLSDLDLVLTKKVLSPRLDYRVAVQMRRVTSLTHTSCSYKYKLA